jgi:hypothetical protein
MILSLFFWMMKMQPLPISDQRFLIPWCEFVEDSGMIPVKTSLIH